MIYCDPPEVDLTWGYLRIPSARGGSVTFPNKGCIFDGDALTDLWVATARRGTNRDLSVDETTPDNQIEVYKLFYGVQKYSLRMFLNGSWSIRDVVHSDDKIGFQQNLADLNLLTEFDPADLDPDSLDIGEGVYAFELHLPDSGVSTRPGRITAVNLAQGRSILGWRLTLDVELPKGPFNILGD